MIERHYKVSRKSVDGGDPIPFIDVFYGEDLCPAVDFFKLMMMMMKTSTQLAHTGLEQWSSNGLPL